MAAKEARITGLCHTAVCVALGAVLVMLLGADGGQTGVVPPNLDSTAQRLRMQDELVALNGKMDELIHLLKSGNVKVVCVRADNDGRGPDYAGGSRDTLVAPAGEAASPSSHAR